METRLEGIVHASGYDPGGQGKQFLGAAVETSDGGVWVVDYEEQSPFRAFAGRHVVAFGEPYEPEGQHLIGRRGAKQLSHFRVAIMRPVEVTPDLQLLEVGHGHHLCGRFDQRTSDSGESMLSFVTEKGDTFLVANEPAGATVGQNVKARVHAVQLSAAARKPAEPYLWIICPYSAADLLEWRGRRS